VTGKEKRRQEVAIEPRLIRRHRGDDERQTNCGDNPSNKRRRSHEDGPMLIRTKASCLE
jgi:hypothetical protein